MFRDMCVLYSYMRVTDNLGDDETLPLDQRRQKLRLWQTDLRDAFAGKPAADPVLTAMVDVALRREIDPSLLEEVIVGVESDLSPREFVTFDELNQYCYQVAGVVGLCCLRIWGCPKVLSSTHQQALDCGTAFQLTNILRDLAEDAQRGRLYLPVEELEEFGISRADLFQGVQSEAFRELMMFQVERAWSFYRKAMPLLEIVSNEGRPILSGFMRAYSSLLKQIQQRGYDVFSERIRLSRGQKLLIAGRSMLRLSGKVSIPGCE